MTWAMFAGDVQAQDQNNKPGTAAALRKALDQKITLDFSTQNFDEAIEHLRQKTKLNFTLDTFILQQMGIGVGFPGGGIIGGAFPQGGIAPGFPGAPNGGNVQMVLKSDNAKIRTALQNFLSPYNLTFVILGDTVLITSEEAGYQRQMRQRVSIDVKNQPLADTLQKLADETGANLLVDPRQAEKAKAKITLQLDDVTLETAFRLLTAVADLSTVRVGNMLFLTDDARAEKLRKENQANDNGIDRLFPGILPPIGRGFVGAAAAGNAVAPPAVILPEQPQAPPAPAPDRKPPAK